MFSTWNKSTVMAPTCLVMRRTVLESSRDYSNVLGALFEMTRGVASLEWASQMCFYPLEITPERSIDHPLLVQFATPLFDCFNWFKFWREIWYSMCVCKDWFIMMLLTNVYQNKLQNNKDEHLNMRLVHKTTKPKCMINFTLIKRSFSYNCSF